MTIEFNPPKSLWPFIQSTKFASLVCGPYGSTKTSAGIMKIAYMAKRVAPCRDGIRRSRAVWVRNTAEQLMDTSIPDFLKWFPDGEAGSFVKTGKRFWLRFDDVECEVLFRGLDDANDVRRLLSLQLTFGIMDEFREISPAIYEALTGRVGRYPDGMMVPHRPEWGVTERGDPVQGCVTDTGAPADAVWGMSNPPDADTYWEELLSNPPENVHVTIQPSGLSDEADWLHFLKPDYYKNLAVGKSQDWIDVYIHAKFGKSLSGQPVFPGFVPDFHVAKGPLTPVISTAHPLIIGMDFGLCYSDDTEVLTERGWKLFKDVDEHADRVATLNPDGFGLEYTDINFKVEYDYDGELIEFRGQNFDFMVTPEHRTPYTTRDVPDRLLFASAEELAAKTTTHNYIQLTADWSGEGMDFFGLPEEQAAVFLGWYLSEGSITCVGNNRRVSIAQKKPCPDLEALLFNGQWWPGTTWVKGPNGYRASVPTAVGDVLVACGKQDVRCVPACLKKATKQALRAFIDAYVRGDGHRRTKAKKHTGIGRKAPDEIRLFTISRQLVDDMQELTLKAGWGSSVQWVGPKDSVMRDGRVIHNKGIFSVCVKRFKRAEIQKQHIRRVPYTGKIYCLNVPYHTLYVRRNGRPCWNGNTPAATISQQDLRGRFLTYAELTSENMGITRFVREKLKPLLANRFPGHPVIVIGDPAGTQRVQTDERTVFDVLRAEGFRVVPARTNSIAARIAAVEGLLAGQVDGGPMHLIDPSCKNLIRALRTGYRYKIRSNGDMDDKPEKNESSHLADAHEYSCLHVDASMVGKGMSGPRRAGAREVKPVRAAGWT